MPIVDPESPHPQYRRDDVALAHFKNLIAARTNPDGSPKQGFRKNVAMLRREIAKIEGKPAPAPESDTPAEEEPDAPAA